MAYLTTGDGYALATGDGFVLVTELFAPPSLDLPDFHVSFRPAGSLGTSRPLEAPWSVSLARAGVDPSRTRLTCTTTAGDGPDA